MSLSARLGKLVGLFAPGTRLAHGKRMYAAARPTEDAAGGFRWIGTSTTWCGQVPASSVPAYASLCAIFLILTGL